MHKIFASDGLELAYQPIFDLATGRIVEVEALSRWPGAPGPFADPELFVRLAEEYGAISRTATTIKIHRRYVSNVRADAYDDAIVRSIVDLAHRINIVLVAEGVEDRAVLEVLRGIGCDRVQGYVCARPMSIDALRAFIDSPQASIASLRGQAAGTSAIAPSA